MNNLKMIVTVTTKKLRNRFIFIKSLLCFIILFTYCITINAQQYYNRNGVSGLNYNWPFNGNYHTQFLYAPNEFRTSGTTGTPVPSGKFITKIYMQAYTASSSATLSTIAIKLSPTSLTTFSTGTFVTTGLTTVYSDSNTIITTVANNWFSITLPTPYPYDPTQGLIVDISIASATNGFQILYWTSSPNKTIYASGYTSTSGSVATRDACFGIDVISVLGYNDAGVLSIDSPSTVCLGSNNIFKATVKNYGANQINGVIVNWSVNGVAQSPTYYSPTLDTLGGSGSNTAQITLGSAMPTSSPVLIKAWTSYPNSVPDTVPGNDSASATKNAAIFGTFTIGSTGANYSSFASAITAMQTNGICGSVTFNVMTGTYNEAINIPPIPGASLSKTITFQSIASIPDSVVINDNGTIPLTLSGSFIKFKSITFNQVSASANCIVMSGSPSYDTIYKCTILAGLNSSNTNYTFHGNGASMNNVVLRKNTFSGSSYGLNFYSYPNWAVNCVIDSNTFQYAYYSPVYNLYNTVNLKMRNNIINVNGVGSSGAMNLQGNDSSFEFASNQINVSSGITENVILGFSNIGNATNRIKIYNNNFSGGTIVFNAYFSDNYIDIYNNVFNSLGYIDFGYLSSNMRFYNNTVNSTSTTNAAFTLHNVSSSGLDVRNNVFSNSGGSYAVNWSAAPSSEICDYNNLYTTGSNLVSINSGATTYANLSAWRGAYNMDKNSLSYRPAFTNANNLSPNISDSACWSLNGRGLPTSWIINDMNGNTRSSQIVNGATDIGAYEFTPSVNPPFAIASPATPSASSTQYFSFGSDTIASVLWGTTIPTSITAQLFSGTNPPQVGSNSFYQTNAYWNVSAPAGTYSYNLKLNYHKNWLQNIPNEINMVIAQKSTAIPWAIASSTHTIDTINNIMTANSLTHFSYFAGTDATFPLPVKLINFTAQKINTDVNLTWQTASELNNDYFEVERSVDGLQFTAIGKVKGNGTTNNVHGYQFTDEWLSIVHGQQSTVYYRLRQVDFDGNSILSEIRVVNFNQTNTDWSIYPNPATNELHIETTGTEKLTAQVFDITGKQILENILFTSSSTINTSSLHEGMYFIRITDADGIVVKTQKVAVVR